MSQPDKARFAMIGDVHDHQARLSRVLDHLVGVGQLDGVLLVGDISRDPPWAQRGSPASLERQRADIARIVVQIEGRLGVPVRFVPGNHDPREVSHPSNLDGRMEVVAGVRIAGIGGAGPARFGFPYEWDEEEIEARELPSADLLLVHAPPRGTTLDRLAHNGLPAGSQAIRARAIAHRGLLVCGHIHEAAGAELLGECLAVNLGALGQPYGRAVVGVVEVKVGIGEWEVELAELDEGSARSWRHVAP